MDKQREEFDRWADEYSLRNEPNYNAETEADCRAAFIAGKEFAQTAMQPEIKTLQVENKCLSDSCREVTTKYQDTKFNLSEAVKNYADVFNQLSADNQRIQELLDLVEVVERRNKQLEERIRMADAEEPVGSISGSYDTEHVIKLLIAVARGAYFLVENMEEFKGTYTAYEEDVFVLEQALDILDTLPEDLQPNVVMTGPAKAEFMLLSTYAAPVIKEQYKVVFYIDPNDLVVDKADKKYVTDIPCDGCTEALFIKEQP